MKLLSGISEGQVLQRLNRRGAAADISGLTESDGPLIASISNDKGPVPGWTNRNVGKSHKGKFAIHLSNIPEGGPYRLELRCGSEGVHVKAFYVGDVWVLAGQSNMQGCGNIQGAASPHPLVRGFSMRREWRKAADPLHVRGESPDVCHNMGIQLTKAQAEEARRKETRGVGPGIFFGREMVRRTGIPQGLICTAHGGTSMTQWSPDRKKEGGKSLYASMISSVRATGQPVAGVLWYQGESDANPTDAPQYTDRMKKLVSATRKDLRLPKLPWIIVQIGRLFANRTPDQILAWNMVQEHQRLLPRHITGLEVVPAIDLPMDDPIHISSEGFPLLGERLAQAADRIVCGSKKEKPTPALARICDPRPGAQFTTIDIHLDNMVGGIHSIGDLNGFSLVADDHSASHPFFRAEINNQVLRLCMVGSTAGYRLSYGHGLTPHCTVVDGRGFPLPVFGPQPLGRQGGYLPFVTRWKVSGLIKTSRSIASLSAKEVASAKMANRNYNNEATVGLINENPRWKGKSGHGYFRSCIRLDEPMKLEFLFGYDGPFRLWIDRKPIHMDLKGTNPCVPDAIRKTLDLAAGDHELLIAMDTNQGNAWGFFLRPFRRDITKAQIKSGNYVRPAYLGG